MHIMGERTSWERHRGRMLRNWHLAGKRRRAGPPTILKQELGPRRHVLGGHHKQEGLQAVGVMGEVVWGRGAEAARRLSN